MNKISFTMTAEDFIDGMKIKNKLLKKYGSSTNSGIKIFAAVFIAAFFAIVIALNEILTAVLFAGLFIIFFVIRILGIKKSMTAVYYQNKLISTQHTIFADENGLSALNGYEKSFTPFDKILHITETADKLIIFTSLTKGMYVLKKVGENSESVAELSKILQQKCQNVYKFAGGVKNAWNL